MRYSSKQIQEHALLLPLPNSLRRMQLGAGHPTNNPLLLSQLGLLEACLIHPRDPIKSENMSTFSRSTPLRQRCGFHMPSLGSTSSSSFPTSPL